MYKYIRNIKIYIIAFLILIASITYIGIYIPMKNELKKATLKNFVLTAKANEMNIQQFLNRCIEGAQGLSSRSMIKKEIIKYKNRDVEFEDLVKYTAQLYKEGYDVLENSIGACRVVDGKIVTQYGIVDTNILSNVSDMQKRLLDIKIIGDKISTIVYSPIKDNNRLLGYDVVFYDMAYVFKDINSGDIEFSIHDSMHLKEMVNFGEKIYVIDGIDILEGEEYTGYIKDLTFTNKRLLVKIENNKLYLPIQNVSRITLLGFIIALIILIFITNLIAMKATGELITNLKMSKEKYKKQATKDGLTDLYSRTYFNQWIERMYKEEGICDNNLFTIVMIDVNGFKNINDTYGHVIGDDVLKEISKILKGSIRENDIAVRYGGDEFLLVLYNCDELVARRIMDRINEKLNGVDKFDFQISVSYGLKEVRNSIELLDAIGQADKDMYEMKNTVYKKSINKNNHM
ncbi:GGDEF domain-containing protein [Clostridiisalibacter paucivorans]|uniref:GGDEF domain-containing protein n=1 Tax=Clostridiisalibacter paucivorans TaxID=408753 RepID=UPI0006842366|nr:GGDEF domain-containing protein [Clostridiisalibacter paucivorans]